MYQKRRTEHLGRIRPRHGLRGRWLLRNFAFHGRGSAGCEQYRC